MFALYKILDADNIDMNCVFPFTLKSQPTALKSNHNGGHKM